MSNQPSNILKQAQLITKVQALLAFDLAITLASRNGQDPTVHLEIQGVRIPLHLYLQASEIEQTIADRAEVLLEELESSGVNTEEILANFKQAGQQILSVQENNQGVDKPQSL